MTVLSYTLSIAPVGGEFRTIAAGTEPIVGVLGCNGPPNLTSGH